MTGLEQTNFDQEMLGIAQEIKLLFEKANQKPGRNIEERLETLDDLMQWLARSAEIMGICKEYYDWLQGEESEKALDNHPGVSPSVLSKIVDGKCSVAKRLVIQSERLNSTITHQGEWLRTSISAEKEERRLNAQQIRSIQR